MSFLSIIVFAKVPKKFMLKSSQFWAPWLQDSSFQHPLDHEAGPEGGIRKCQLRLFRGVVC